jgi:alkylation response protein AidB-like acyl-CoA dehydrogenase
MGIRMVAHAIVAFGTAAQKDYFLPRTLTGEVFFCQASLSMAATDDHTRPGGQLDVRSGPKLRFG